MSHSGCSGGPPNSVPPIYTIPLPSFFLALISVDVYRNRTGGVFNFGADYEGDYFFTDYFSGDFWRLDWNGSAWVLPPPVPGQPNGTQWATAVLNISDSRVGPDGAVYYTYLPANGGPGSVRRIRPDSRQLLMTSGDNQVGTAGQPLALPFIVEVRNASGAPVAGVPVTFALTAGGGVLSPQPALTNAQGQAGASFTLATSPPTDPVVTASVSGAPSQSFQVAWRGITVTYDPSQNSLTTSLVHSKVSAPFTLAIDTPQPGPVITPYGSVWTSILSPTPTAAVLDGLGLLGPANPIYVTGTQSPVWSATFILPLLGGVTMVFQGYAFDSSLLPAANAILISNEETVLLN